MARDTHVLSTMKHPEGEWRVNEMMMATEEANKVAERLESERCTLEQEHVDSSLADLAN